MYTGDRDHDALERIIGRDLAHVASSASDSMVSITASATAQPDGDAPEWSYPCRRTERPAMRADNSQGRYGKPVAQAWRRDSCPSDAEAIREKGAYGAAGSACTSSKSATRDLIEAPTQRLQNRLAHIVGAPHPRLAPVGDHRGRIPATN